MSPFCSPMCALALRLVGRGAESRYLKYPPIKRWPTVQKNPLCSSETNRLDGTGDQILHRATETSAILLSVAKLSVYSQFLLKIQNFLDFWRSLFLLSLSFFFQQPLELTRKILRDKQNKKNSGQPVPVFPSWVYERPALIGDFLIGTSLSTDTTVPIGMWYTGKTALTYVLYLFRSAVQISWHSGWEQNLAPCTLQLKSGVQKNHHKLTLFTVFLLYWIPAPPLSHGI